MNIQFRSHTVQSLCQKKKKNTNEMLLLYKESSDTKYCSIYKRVWTRRHFMFVDWIYFRNNNGSSSEYAFWLWNVLNKTIRMENVTLQSENNFLLKLDWLLLLIAFSQVEANVHLIYTKYTDRRSSFDCGSNYSNVLDLP